MGVSRSSFGQKPYQDVIEKLMKTDEIESPMSKLEHIYNCCTTEI